MPNSPVFKLLDNRLLDEMRIMNRHISQEMLFLQKKIDSNIMRIDSRFQKALLGHLFLSILFFWYYTNNSFLRPAVETGTECFLALLIIVAAEVNFWIIYPSCQNNSRRFFYFVLSFVEIIALSIIEYHLTSGAKLSKIPIELSDIEISQIKIIFFTNLLFRNCGLISVVMILAYNTDLRIRLFEKDRKLFRLKKQLMVQSINGKETHFLDADQICYIQQNQNYNRFYTYDGQLFERRSSMLELQQLLGDEQYLKISKSVIVSKSYIKALAEDVIVLRTDQNTEDYQLKIGKSYLSEVLPVVESILKTANKEIRELEHWQSENLSPELHPKALAIFRYISTHPECKITDIMRSTEIPKSTVTRYLKELQQISLIEYTGSKRAGGYRVVEKGVNINT